MIKVKKLITHVAPCSSWREDKVRVTSEIHPSIWKLLQRRQLSFPPYIKVIIVDVVYYVSSSLMEEDFSPLAQPRLTWMSDL